MHSPSLWALHPSKFSVLLLDMLVPDASVLWPGRRSPSQSPGKSVCLFGNTLVPCKARWHVSHHCLSGRQARDPLKPLKSVFQRVQLLASWIRHRSGSRALLNSRCFTLRPLPSFPGRRAAHSIRRVTGTRKKEELEGERERKGQSEWVQKKSELSSEHPQITLSPASSDKHQEREREREEGERERHGELNRGANKELCQRRIKREGVKELQSA